MKMRVRKRELQENPLVPCYITRISVVIELHLQIPSVSKPRLNDTPREGVVPPLSGGGDNRDVRLGLSNTVKPLGPSKSYPLL